MKKILYICDYGLEEYNSVRDILYNIIKDERLSECDQAIAIALGYLHQPFMTSYYEDIKTYFTSNQSFKTYLKSKKVSFADIIRTFFHRVAYVIMSRLGLEKAYIEHDKMAYIKRVMKVGKPDLMVFLIFDPNKRYADLCKKRKIPYISFLYDTYIDRPGIDKNEGYRLEKHIIDNSEKYFIPSFFYDAYTDTYKNNSKLGKCNLPLLIDEKQVIQSFENSSKRYRFVYFGQIQNFRNGSEINDIFKKMGYKLDVFTTEKYQNNESFSFHKAITGQELFDVVAGSDYLVVFDNNCPYQHYLPSKAYLYASFTKPILAFGENDESALKTFFYDHPMFYYHNIHDPIDGILEFLNCPFQKGFDKNLYVNYLEYLPQNALKPLVEEMLNVLNKNDK